MKSKNNLLLIVLVIFISQLWGITSLELVAPVDAKVTLDGKVLNDTNSDGQYLKSGLPIKKKIEVKVELDGFEDYYHYIEFSNSFDSKNVVISKADLTPSNILKKKNVTGTVQVISVPNNIEFKINNNQQYTNTKFSQLKVGEYNFEFINKGKSLKGKVNFVEGGNYVVQADFTRDKLLFAKEVIIRTEDKWETLEINGNIVSENSNYYNDFFEISALTEIVAYSKGQRLEKTIDFSNNFEDLVFSDMVLVEGGSFLMGNDAKNAEKDEKPVHKVVLDDFMISKHEVTQKEWRSVMKTNPSRIKDDQHPVNGISWVQAINFCNEKSIIEKLEPVYTINGLNVTADLSKNGYRLPTEAEWEYAARGGKKSKNYTYSGSNKVDEVAFYAHNSKLETHPVGQKKPNELGLFDMSGNVQEWCWDWYGAEYYQESPTRNPQGVDNSRSKVLRGGNYRDVASKTTCTVRWVGTKSTRRPFIGFRIVRKP